ncbi:MAG: 1,4-beta-xylanase [Opitutales bacterium]
MADSSPDPVTPETVPGRWPVEQAKAWYAAQPWLVGCIYIPANAINQLEMWQAETFDPDTIRRELGWAQDLGFNSLRVYLHNLLWADDADGMYARMDTFLDLCRERSIRTFFVLFDDCHHDSPQPGPQPLPVPGYHNTGWLQSPGRKLGEAYARGTISEAHRARLEGFVKETIRQFANDERVLAWDLYNEPGRGVMPGEIEPGQPVPHFGDGSSRLVLDSFRWAREVAPSQPIFSTAEGSVGEVNIEIAKLNSDVYAFHSYDGPEGFEKTCRRYAEADRPALCTEYMARTTGCTFEACLPILKQYNIGAYNWGFVAGKTGCIWPWGSGIPGKNKHQARAEGIVESEVTRLPEPELWFHEVLRLDGTPYRQEEVDCIRRLTREANG